MTALQTVATTDPERSSPDPGAATRWWRSRFGYRMLIELAAVLIGFVVYKAVRLAAKDDFRVAFVHATSVVQLERHLGIFNEVDLQRAVTQHPSLVRAANRYYESAHLPATGLGLVWLYVRHPHGYVRTRRVLVATSAAAMVIHVMYPLVPPRMIPALGFVDTGHVYGPATYGNDGLLDRLANQVAAMPSLHFGWALIIAVAAVRSSRSHLRWIVALHPVLTVLVIVITGNHYWLDALVALGLVLLAYALVPAPRPAGDAIAPAERRSTVDPAVADRRIDLTDRAPHAHADDASELVNA